MEMQKVRDFLKEHNIPRIQLAEELSYAKPTMVNILNRKEVLEGRMKMLIYMGLKKIIEKKMEHCCQGLQTLEEEFKP